MIVRKRPVKVECFQLGHDNLPEWFVIAFHNNEIDIIVKDNAIVSAQIHTLEGIMTAEIGSYIIQGVQGEIYPVKEDIFHETYEILDTNKKQSEKRVEKFHGQYW